MHRAITERKALRWFILVPLLGMCAQLGGQDFNPALLLQKIEEMEATQKRMQAQIDRLTAQVAATPAATPAPVVVASPAEESVAADTLNASSSGHVLGPVEFRGFSDIGYGRAWFEKLPPGGLSGTPRSFNVGDFDLFVNTRISEHWSVLGEMLVTSDFSNEFSVEMDRLLLSYKRNDYFNVSFGKFNTALGYYPGAFNRARYFQTATSRPVMYGDEDNNGILPVHRVDHHRQDSFGPPWIALDRRGHQWAVVHPPRRSRPEFCR
jgi:hypothetical protein